MPRADQRRSGSGDRDRTIDVLRALGTCGVVTGHWLVTAVVVDTVGWGAASPLHYLPSLTPVTWVLQTLASLFFAAGYAAAASLGRAPGYGRWLRERLVCMARGSGYLAGFWLPLLLVLGLTGTPFGILGQVGRYVVSPLWFLVVLTILLALTPFLLRHHWRWGVAAALVPCVVVLADDLSRFGPWSAPTEMVAVLGWAALPCAWMVPFQWGIALARGGFTGRWVALGLLGAGAVAAASLVAGAGYPASMVGGTGQRSNIDPPSLLQLAFSAVQISFFLLARPWIARIVNRRRLWLTVTEASRLALHIYMWHQSALVLVILASATVAPMPGLVDEPSSMLWVLHRVCWLPLVGAVLVGVVRLHRARPAAGWARQCGLRREHAGQVAKS